MRSNEFNINGFLIKNGEKPFFIAEVGSNHNQSFDTACKLIDVAADAGANAVKFQLFRAEKLYPPGTRMFDLFKSIELSSDWLDRLNRHAKDVGILLISSAFDKESVDLLDEIGIPAFKVASSETTNLRLLSYIAAKKKPIIISTGMCDMIDIYEAINICKISGNSMIAILQCGAMYPLQPDLANLRVLGLFQSAFRCPVGFSDHTLGVAAGVSAIGHGACIIEKHFTLNRQSEGPDHSYAMEPEELKNYIGLIHEAHSAQGDPIKDLLPIEKQGRREGLFAACDIDEGEIVKQNQIVIDRPAPGIRARYLGTVVGAKVKSNISKGAPLAWENIVLIPE